MTSPDMTFDVIVVGLGAMGSAAAYHLARRGARVLGLDRYAPPHALGSSHGHTRIIRQAYFEHPLYVPLVQRAYTLWEALEAEQGERLLSRNGGLMLGAPDSAVVRGALESARQHALPHDVLSTDALRARFPQFAVHDDTVGVLEPDAGYLRPERCIAAHLAGARQHGASLRFGEPVQSWRSQGASTDVVTAHGMYTAAHVVFAAGPWTGELLPSLALPLRVERVVQLWFEPVDDARLREPAFPVFIWETEPGRAWYGFPNRPEGMKLALHHQGATTTADTVSRDVTQRDIDAVLTTIARYLPAAVGPVRERSVCLYTNTPDNDFILDTPHDMPGVIVASPCSGHGFKFSSAIGEAIAELALDGKTTAGISAFRLSRFASRAGA